MRHFILANIIIMCLTAHAATLGECRQLAKENFPLVKSYAILDKTEQFTLETASKAWLPQVQLGAQASWQNHAASYPEALSKMLEAQGLEAKGMRKDQYRISADVQQMVWDGGRISASKNTASRTADESRRSNDVEIYNLYQRVDDVFFSIILLAEQGKAVDASIELLKANVNTLTAMLRNGAAMQSDVDAMQAQLLEAQQQKSNIEATAESFKKVLALYIGADTCPALEMPSDPSANASGARPELALFDARQATLAAKEKEVRASLMPTLSLFGTTFYGYPGFNSMDAIISHKWSWNLMVGARLTWNVSALYSKNSKLNQLRAQSEYVENQREMFEYNQNFQKATQRDEINRLTLIANGDDEIVALRSRVRVAEEAKLREGIINATELLRKITDEQKAKITQASHIIEILRAKYKLNHTLGYENQ